ncbi:Rv3654c family TadE-like protein [Streptomyces sp. NPDC018031]|uniref:Rv3654c family TadE-like protein n=1 Tax=Streptomyces sp. NPDC018031 TaxID=3365033 RepID=UPI0037B32738
MKIALGQTCRQQDLGDHRGRDRGAQREPARRDHRGRLGGGHHHLDRWDDGNHPNDGNHIEDRDPARDLGPHPGQERGTDPVRGSDPGIDHPRALHGDPVPVPVPVLVPDPDPDPDPGHGLTPVPAPVPVSAAAVPVHLTAAGRGPTAGPGPDGGRARGSWRERDRGSATVWAAVAATALCAVFAALFTLGQVTVARHRAGGAADLAALAAADHALQGPRAACRLAERVAGAQGARVVRCGVQGEIADLTAEVRTGPFTSRVRSRAGPAEAIPPERGPAPGQSPREGARADDPAVMPPPENR